MSGQDEAKGTERELTATVRLLLGIIEKRKWFALAVLLGCTSLSVLFSLKQESIYQATSTLIIERRSPSVLSRVKEVIELGSGDYWSIKEYMQTQFEVLQSRRLAKRVMDRLALNLDERFHGVDRVRPQLSAQEKRERMARADAVSLLLSCITIEPKKDSQMVLVHVRHRDPRMAQEIANTLVEEYKEENLEHKKRVVTEAIGELRKMTVTLQREKEAAESRMLEFERRHTMSSLDMRKAQLSQRLSLLNGQHVDAVIRRTQAEASRLGAELAERIGQLEQLLTGDDPGFAVHPVLVSSGSITALKQRLIELETKVRETSERYGPKHPSMQAVYGQRGLVRKALQTEARILLGAELKSLTQLALEEENRIRAVREIEEKLALQLYDARIEEATLAKLELDYVPLKKKVEEAQAVYDNVKERYSETTLSAQVETNNIRIQDLATLPEEPVSPNRKVNVLVGVVLGLILGIGAAYFVELLDSSIKTREDIEASPHVSFLGLVPSVDSLALAEPDQALKVPELYVYHHPKSSVAEHFRTIKTNLLFSRPSERRARIFLVTSPGPKEGKTTVGCNLAAIAAMSGARSLVVDTDMRRPRVHKFFEMARRPGISEFMIGTQPASAYCRPTVVEGLDVLTCGSLAANPLEILESAKFREMISALAAEYDLIMFDSPPLLAVADAKIVCSMVDTAILVVRAGATAKEGLREARGALYPVIDEDVGVVLNGFDVERHSYRYYYYRSKNYSYYNYYSYDDGRMDGEEEGVKGNSSGGRSERWGRRSG